YPAGSVPVEAELLGQGLVPLDPKARPTLAIKRPRDFNPETDRDTPEKVELKARVVQGADWNGRFAASVRFMTPGEYELELPIPGTGETLRQTLTITEPNVEMDN